ncbi:MAG TPA: hypothetical protein VFL12_04550 [Thermoanaerobaculia bacterium]|nr:hypothetical protein [Thermoanaerobaculia bacterium]
MSDKLKKKEPVRAGMRRIARRFGIARAQRLVREANRKMSERDGSGGSR